jgi:hypothetical protein
VRARAAQWRQLEAYNARDLEAFMAVMADDVVVGCRVAHSVQG